EFYQLYAFFNNMNEKAMDGNALLPPPMMKLPTPEQEKKFAELNAAIAPIEQRIRDEVAKISYQEPKTKPAAKERSDYVWVDDDFPAGAKVERSGAELRWVENEKAFSGRRAIARTDEG